MHLPTRRPMQQMPSRTIPAATRIWHRSPQRTYRPGRHGNRLHTSRYLSIENPLPSVACENWVCCKPGNRSIPGLIFFAIRPWQSRMLHSDRRKSACVFLQKSYKTLNYKAFWTIFTQHDAGLRLMQRILGRAHRQPAIFSNHHAFHRRLRFLAIAQHLRQQRTGDHAGKGGDQAGKLAGE